MQKIYRIMSVAERINQIISEKKLSVRAFSKKIDCADTAIGNIIKGRNEPGYKILFAILEQFNDISPEWLMTGKGNMLKNTGTLMPEDQQHLFDICEELKKRCEKMKGELEEKDAVIKNLVKTNLLLVEAKNGGVAHRGNDAECADVG